VSTCNNPDPTSYSNGHGVPINKQKASHWFQLAADQGSELARKNLVAVQQSLSLIASQELDGVQDSVGGLDLALTPSLAHRMYCRAWQCRSSWM
jgi:TPR repeat protein